MARSQSKMSIPSLDDLPRKSFVLNPRNVKRVGKRQIKFISQLISDETELVFGEVPVLEYMIFNNTMTLGIDDDHGKLAGVMSFKTYPNIRSIPPWEWEYWLHNLYGVSYINQRNTLWIAFYVYDSKYEMFFAKTISHHVFRNWRFVENLCLVLPPGVNKVDCMEDLATRKLPKECRNPNKTQSILVITRSRFMAKYKVRRAVEEDNDDLVPLIDMHSKLPMDTYGEYYIAEILTKHRESGRQIVVAEYEGRAVSVMILNETINYDVLNEEFELTPLNGLKKKSAEDIVDLEVCSQTEIIQSGMIEIDPSMETSTTDHHHHGKKMFKDNFEDEDEFLIDVNESESDYSLVITTSDLFVFDEDEEPDIEQEDSDGILHPTHSTTSYEILKEIEKVKGHEQDPRIAYLDMVERLSKSIASTKSSKRKAQVPKFVGKGNAFCIEVAACHPDHQASLFLVLSAVYECFPEKDYCVMSLPYGARFELWMAPFVRPTPRFNSTFPAELYVLHKNAILGRIDVQVATKERLPEIETLLSTLPTHPVILSQFHLCLTYEHSPYQCFVFLCEDKVVGTAVLSEEYHVDYLNAQYDIQPWVPLHVFASGSYGVIESIVISPIFISCARYFKRELHRLSDFKVLFYKHRTYDKQSYKERPVCNLLQWLLPVMPRRQPEYDLKMMEEEGFHLAEGITRKDYYALYVSTVSSCALNRLTVNNRIVVVGCSNTAYAFLESLILTQKNPNYQTIFLNVSLVCGQGLHPKVPKKARDLFLVQKNFMTGRYLDMVSLKTYVNVVSGTMTKIDRKNQYILLNDHSILYYDLLFLMCGEKFQKPLQDYRMPFQENPDNVFLINGPLDGTNAVQKLKELQNSDDYEEDLIIIYGHFLQAYSCLAGLLEYGIPGSQMILVEPFPYSMNIDKKRRHNISVFNDPDIYHACMDFIAQQGIKVYSAYYFIDWNYNLETNMVNAAKFESKHKMLTLGCQAIFFFYDKSISPRVYQVINQAGLVFDGRLVIDNNCRTNDERIFGAGTLTKYSRKYFATNMVHKYFNRVEIGNKLGQQIRNMLVPSFVKRTDPKKHGWNFHLDIRDRLVPKYEEPIMRYCRLPGGLYYLSIVKPGRRIPLETASSFENYGQVFITGSCRNLDHQGFFKLHLNEYNRVETITCLTKFPIDVKNIHCLWGKQEKMLNNLILRFEMVLITDFFEYFKQPWAFAIYHDRFERLMDELNNLMTSSVGVDGECLITDVIDAYKQRKWKPLTQEQNDEIEANFPNMLYPKIIEQKVLDFIQENLVYLPMYAHPVVIRTILEGFDKSPLFAK